LRAAGRSRGGRIAMTIASLAFLGFAVAVAALYSLLPMLWARQALLLAANLAFAATFISTPLAAAPLLGFLAVGYLAQNLLCRDRSRRTFVVVLAAVIALFFWLKHYSFVPAASFLPFAYSTIGLSYIFFRTLHVLIDTRDGEFDDPAPGLSRGGRIGPVAFLNYTLNFTSLVSGPIQLFGDYAADQLTEKRPPFDWADLGFAAERIAIGFFKVEVLATILYAVHRGALADLPLAADLTRRVTGMLLIGVGYTLYLYCNFSGYTDIVIGAARLYRLKLPENFNRPFAAASFIELWSRWHITLSSWLKVYVYNPLTMALMGRFRSPRGRAAGGVFAYFVTFFLVGLWHGQTSEFAMFGVLQGAGVALNKVHQLVMTGWLGGRGYQAVADRLWYRASARGLTFGYFTLSLFLFWGSWREIGAVLSAVGAFGCVAGIVAMIAGAALVLSVVAYARERLDTVELLRSRYTRTVWTTMMAFSAIVVLNLMASPAPDIVYKQF
jgi:alginate O-acetyltransferase complex protein AlgI